MGRYDENIEGVRTRTMTLFYLFDNSGSMAGTKIGQVNYAMKEIPKIIKDIAENAPNANINVVAASFSDSVEWLTPKPQTPDEFLNTWKDITAGGLTSMGQALKELNAKMSRKQFLSENPMGYYSPAVIILSDGVPTDDWASALKEIKKNNWFKSAIKVGFAVGSDADESVLAEICGSPEAVVSIENNDKIRQYIKFVTAAVSRTGTIDSSSTGQDAQQIVNEQIQNAENDDGSVDLSSIQQDDDWE